MRLAFAGTPQFATRALAALSEAGHDIRLVLTQPDRPAGRGLITRASPVAVLSASMGLTTLKPATLKASEVEEALRDAAPEAMVVAAYGLLLPRSVLTIPPRGCLNIHASLLPRWRGAAPIQRAILAGDLETGVSIMLMEPGLDTGPVLYARRLPISVADTTGSVTERLAEAGAEAIVAVLSSIDCLVANPQDPATATYAAKLEKAELIIDWHDQAVRIDRLVRACNPAPGARTMYAGSAMKILGVRLASGSGDPGAVIGYEAGCPVVACGIGALALTMIQRSGSQILPGREFVKARPMLPGTFME